MRKVWILMAGGGQVKESEYRKRTILIKGGYREPKGIITMKGGLWDYIKFRIKWGLLIWKRK